MKKKISPFLIPKVSSALGVIGLIVGYNTGSNLILNIGWGFFILGLLWIPGAWLWHKLK